VSTLSTTELVKVRNTLARALSVDDVNQLGRDTGQATRLRTVTPHRLFLAVVSTLASAHVESLADLLRVSLAKIASGQKSLTGRSCWLFYRPCAQPSGRSLDSGQPCAHVETSCSRSLPCATNFASSLVPIDAFVHLTVCSGCACDVCGLDGGKRWCWSSQPRLPGRNVH
jgi:hypothetical protein